MLLVPSAIVEAQSDTICRELRERGFSPDWVGWNGDQDIAVRVNIAPDGDLAWRKAFTKAREEATSDAFIAAIDEWRIQIIADIRRGQPSKTVQAAIAHYGLIKVLDMLGAVQ